jgi:hypothetical protein
MANVTTVIKRLFIRQNADFSITYALSTNGTAIDLTGCSVLAQIRSQQLLTSQLFYTFNSLEDGSCTINADAGTITLFMNQTQALALTWDNPAYYDVIITWSDSTTNCLVAGEAILLDGVTNPEDL